MAHYRSTAWCLGLPGRGAGSKIEFRDGSRTVTSPRGCYHPYRLVLVGVDGRRVLPRYPAQLRHILVVMRAKFAEVKAHAVRHRILDEPRAAREGGDPRLRHAPEQHPAMACPAGDIGEHGIEAG